MIGKPEWFSPRKFGWGLGIRTKEGVFYIIAVSALFFAVSFLPLSFDQKAIAWGVLLIVTLADFLHIMSQVYSQLDEREEKHQLVSERNAALIGIVGMTAYIGYLVASGVVKGPDFNKAFIILPIAIVVAMSLAKGVTLLILERDEK